LNIERKRSPSPSLSSSSVTVAKCMKVSRASSWSSDGPFTVPSSSQTDVTLVNSDVIDLTSDDNVPNHLSVHHHGTYQNVIDVIEVSSDDEAVPVKKAKTDEKGKGRIISQDVIIIDDSD
jgi:hypothetical protein